MKKRFISALCAICACVTSVSFNTPASASYRGEYITYGDLVPETAHPGNIFYGSEDIKFKIPATNHTSGKIYGQYRYTITDEAGDTIYTSPTSSQTSLGAGASGYHTITLPKNGKYGIYTLNLTVESGPNLNSIDSNNFSAKFSVCIPLDDNNVNPSFGFNQKIVNSGNYPDAVSLMKKAGAKWHREDVLWSGVEPTTPEDYIDLEPYRIKLKNLNDNGIETVCILNGRNSLYDNNKCPSSDDAIAAYASFCEYVADKLKGVVDHYEIYNEWNSSQFNQSNESPETYAKVLQAAYTAIKKVDPDITVIGGAVAGIDMPWIRRVLNAGGGNYMDVLSVHCYDFETNNGFPEQSFRANAETLKAELATRNLNLPVWLTEIGFSTYTGPQGLFFVPGCTEDVQLNSMVMLGAVNKVYGLYNNIIQYGLNDRGTDNTTIEQNWGVLYDYQNGDLKNGAKPAYLGLAAMNYFIGGNTEYISKEEDTENRQYAFSFYNHNLDKKVTLLISGGPDNTANRQMNLGCRSIDVYDKYGNRISQLKSETGGYKLPISSEPMYIVYGPEFTVTKNNIPVTDMSALTSGDSLAIGLSGINAAAKTQKVIAAQYNGERLIKADSFAVSGTVFSENVTVAEGADRIKIVYWSMDNLIPLCRLYDIY